MRVGYGISFKFHKGNYLIFVSCIPPVVTSCSVEEFHGATNFIGFIKFFNANFMIELCT